MLHLDQVITYWDNVRSVTERFLDVFPPEHLDFRPIETVFTARDQFQHLIASQAMFARGWTAGVWDFPWQHGRWVARDVVDESFETIPGIRRFYMTVHGQALQFLRGLPTDAGSRIYQTHLGPLSIDAMALYAIDEEIHHRAQVGIYLRCLGIQPPPFLQRYQDLCASPMQETWDGKAIAAEAPFGATVVVYRKSPRGTEYLLLHRAHNGKEFEGDWAWTPPAGARHPGEPIEVCARRELLEEAGLDVSLRRLDGSSADWAVFLAEAPGSAEVVLRDAEHDRFEWVSLTEALRRCKPPKAAIGFGLAVRALCEPRPEL